MYQSMQNDYTKKTEKDWVEKTELKNSSYEYLAKLAANPYLWDKPCISEKELELKKQKGEKAKAFVPYCKHAFIRKTAQDKVTLEDFTYTAYKLDKDSKGNYIIMTNKEKLLSDILEYNAINVRYKDAPDLGLSVHIQFPKEAILIQANTGRKAQASRQCFNARIQGSAATLTKLAMIDIANDKQMNDMQAKLIIPVHDELLVECPAFYSAAIEKRLPELMINAAKKANDPIPQACDPDICDRWYANEMAAHLLDDYNELINGNVKKNIEPLSHEDALAKIISENTEFPAEAIKHSIETGEELKFE